MVHNNTNKFPSQYRWREDRGEDHSQDLTTSEHRSASQALDRNTRQYNITAKRRRKTIPVSNKRQYNTKWQKIADKFKELPRASFNTILYKQ